MKGGFYIDAIAFIACWELRDNNRISIRGSPSEQISLFQFPFPCGPNVVCLYVYIYIYIYIYIYTYKVKAWYAYAMLPVIMYYISKRVLGQ